ncbi:hypothetical protein SAMN07250955_110103 [Arboricoccus pini]|uniref:Uncharacterized protein n=1 Tax=Arboricoccus pini TaxID=1963835 RepID=A0A212RLE3_9PROT|nr:DUF6097 family protein [Arboricoccus pini]SNB73287.1 hypothetical protein SAMN07250955_110103 [Arboricoccus pini]
MNFLYTFGSNVLFNNFAMRQIEAFHAFIDSNKVPVNKIDDLYKQTIALDRLAGTGGFERCFRRYSITRKILIILAIVIIIPALSIFLISKIQSLEAITNSLKEFMISNFMEVAYTLGIGGALLLAFLIGGYFYAQSQLDRLVGPELGQVWHSIIEKWAPEIKEQTELTDDPSEIADLIVGK